MFVSVAAKVFTLPKQYPCSRKKSVSKNVRENKNEIQLDPSKIFQRGKSRLFKTRTHMGETSQTKVTKKPMKRPTNCLKGKKWHRGSLTASDLWRLNRSSHNFSNTMGRKARKGRKCKQRYNKVNSNLLYM
jgi:hypothetical protein